jgi:hypothetical protein
MFREFRGGSLSDFVAAPHAAMQKGCRIAQAGKDPVCSRGKLKLTRSGG